MTDSQPDNPLIFGYVLDGKGGGRPIEWSEIMTGLPSDEPFWLHLERTHPMARSWVSQHLELEEWSLDGLFDEETRPRCTAVANGVLLNLRGVNLNPGADPTDMVALRIWVSQRGIVTLRRYPIKSVAAMGDRMKAGHGAENPGRLIASISEKLMDLMGPIISKFDAVLDDAELMLLQTDKTEPPSGLAEARRGLTALRRFLKPQAEALLDLLELDPDFLDDTDKAMINNARQDVLRFVEHLDEMREQAIFVYDEIEKRQDDRMNRSIYRLTIITAIFLPLGFITGLLGINVGGMPGTDSASAFWIVCAIFGFIAVATYGGFKLLGYWGSRSRHK